MNTPSKVVLQYGRTGDLSSGEILVVSEKPVVSLSFDKIAFDRMLYVLAATIATTEECEVWLVRTDRQGSLPYKLDASTVGLLRTDPVAAVAALSYPGSPQTLFARAREQRPLQPLRAGFDVLADAFGDQVYVRVVGHELECPGCGFWSPALEAFGCVKRCHVALPLELATRWAGARVADLLATDLTQFYLPRVWNPESWITRVDLDKRYRDFLNQKERASCSKALA